MQDLLQQAAEALCVHQADMLEQLAARMATSRILSCDAKQMRVSIEAFRLQISAARAHLKLLRNLQATGYAVEHTWAR